MNQYRVRPGVVLIELKGNWLLVATKEAREYCRYVCPVNSSAAFLWEMIKKGCSYEEILAGFEEKYEIDDTASLEKDIQSCIGQLEEKGYLYCS